MLEAERKLLAEESQIMVTGLSAMKTNQMAWFEKKRAIG
jgi:hypothetical protein